MSSKGGLIMELNQAQQIANRILVDISVTCHRCQVAGSVRREKPNVKDIEIVAIVKDYAELYRRLSKFGRFIKPGVPDIIDWPAKPGAKYVRMLLNEGVKLDFFVASSDNWGALLTMRTGPAMSPIGRLGFAPLMFSAFKQVSGGGRMQGCLPTMPDGRQLVVPEEKDFFSVCGVKWVEPKDRSELCSLKRHKIV